VAVVVGSEKRGGREDLDAFGAQSRFRSHIYASMSLCLYLVHIWADEWHWEDAFLSRGTCLRESDDSELEYSK
jgi:hypothetical protein